jgi:hypothetical protein
MNTTSQPFMRPPWPDELSRTWKFFGQNNIMKGRVYPLIAVIGEPERIVAGAALQIEGTEIGRLFLNFRSRFCDKDRVDAFLHEIAVFARKEGLKKIITSLPEFAPWRAFLETAGFTCQRTDEWWSGARDAQKEARLKKAAELIRSVRVTKNLTIASLTVEDYAEVQAIVTEHGLANLERLGTERMLAGYTPGEYSADLSLVVRLNNEVAGILLVKDFGDQAFIHVRAVAKKYLAYSNTINAHFFAKLIQPEYNAINRIIFSAQPTVEKETIAMAKRFGCNKIACFCNYQMDYSN